MKNRSYFKNCKKLNTKQKRDIQIKEQLINRSKQIVCSIGFTIMFVVTILCLCLFTSCATQKRCENRYPHIEMVRDSVIIEKEVVLRDTIVEVRLLPDTIITIKEIPVSVDICPIMVENNNAMAKAWIKNSHLWLQIFNKPNPIAFTLQNKTTTEQQTRIIRKTQRVKYVSSWHKWCSRLIIAQIIALVSLCIYSLLKLRNKLI